MNRIEKKFSDCKAQGRAAFIAFITAGYPDLATTGALIEEFADRGVDIVELGIPFSDPMADGPVIQEASQYALQRKVHLSSVIALVRQVRRKVQIPICFMSYYNPIFCYGEARFVAHAKDAGVDGVIIPDLPPEEADTFIPLARRKDLDTVFFLSPTSTRRRVKTVAAAATGFIYYVSLTGVTGARSHLPSGLAGNIRAIKAVTRKPVCVGFGVSRPEQVKGLARVADGVIVGSAIVNKIKENIGTAALVKKVGSFVETFTR